MPPAGFAPSVLEDERSQPHALDHAVTYAYLHMQISIPVAFIFVSGMLRDLFSPQALLAP